MRVSRLNLPPDHSGGRRLTRQQAATTKLLPYIVEKDKPLRSASQKALRRRLILVRRLQDLVQLRDSKQLSKSIRDVDQLEPRSALDCRHLRVNELSEKHAVHVRHMADVEKD